MASKILFGKMFWLSFMWLSLMYSVYMWNLSSVFRCVPFLWYLSTCIVFWMAPMGWSCSMRCCAYLDVWLLVWNACLCSLKRIAKFLPVCPTYALLHTGHVSLYIPDCVYLSVLCVVCVSLLLMVLFVLYAILRLVFLNMLVMNVVSLPVYVNVVHFCFSVNAVFLCISGLCLVGFCGWIGKELFVRILWIVCSSCLFLLVTYTHDGKKPPQHK